MINFLKTYFLNLALITWIWIYFYENIPGWRESIINKLGQYLASTDRLFSRVADEDVLQ